MPFDFNKVVKSMDEIRQRKQEELTKLCEHPRVADVVMMITDEYLNDLSYLFNYTEALWGNGQGQTDTQDIYQELQDRFMETYKRYTGHEYLPTAVRDMRYRRVLQEHKEKFLKIVMDGVKEEQVSDE